MTSDPKTSLYNGTPLPHHPVVIIGSGPAAHTAAIYTARAELKPVLFEGFLAGGVAAGGQLTMTTEVENFPGFPKGLTGPELMDGMREQSVKFGTTIHTETVDSVDFSRRPFLVTTSSQRVLASTVILSTGATAKRLAIVGTRDGEFWQAGVSACAVCDGAIPMFRNQPLAVVGGGDSAMEEATFLTKYGRRVYIVHRRDELRASKAMQARAMANPKIEFLYSSVVDKVTGEGPVMDTMHVRNLKTDTVTAIPVAGLFFAIGHTPNTSFLSSQLRLDATGYVLAGERYRRSLTKSSQDAMSAEHEGGHGMTVTSVEGVFACGDVQDPHYRQAVTAAGSGCMAALDCEAYLQANPEAAL